MGLRECARCPLLLMVLNTTFFCLKEATLSVEMTAKEELRIALEKLKKESQKECDVLAMEVWILRLLSENSYIFSSITIVTF